MFNLDVGFERIWPRDRPMHALGSQSIRSVTVLIPSPAKSALMEY